MNDRSAVRLIATRALRIILLLMLVRGTDCLAQDVTGAIQGHVVSEVGGSLQGARVTVSGPSLQGSREVFSDVRGQARIPALPVGSYTVVIRQIGFRPMRYENVTVRLGHTSSLGDVRLVQQTAELSEIVVRGDRAPIDATTTTTGLNLRASTISSLPVDRNFHSLITLAPQANVTYLADAEANVAGSTGYENAYFIDGMHVTQPKFGKTGPALPYNFVKEIQVKTGGYEPEYGRALGGIVNVVTPSGGNEFTGGTFAFFTNNRFRAERLVGVLDKGVKSFATYDVGGSLGGPIARDRLWFFVAYNPNISVENIQVPSFGLQRDRRVEHLFAGKITWQAAARTNVVLTVLGDPTTHHRIGGDASFGAPASLGNVDPVLADEREGGLNVSLLARHVRQLVMLESAVFVDRRSADVVPSTTRGAREPLFIDQTTNAWSGGYGSVEEGATTRAGGRFNATTQRAAHSLKVGAELEENILASATHAGVDGLNGGWLFRTPLVYVWARLRSDGTVHNRVVSSYVQDSWSVTEKLRIIGGVRWDGQIFVDRTGRVAQSILDQWQPRLGFTYAGENGQKAFASVGRFYEQLPLFFAHIKYAGLRLYARAYPNDPRSDSTIFFPITDAAAVIEPRVHGLRGEHYDEAVVGYEALVASRLKVGARAVRRELREIVEDAFTDPANLDSRVLGNPGRGRLTNLPHPERRYMALELTLESADRAPLTYAASYVLSRNFGNYAGLFPSDQNLPGAINFGPPYDDTTQISSGLLPNDRTHVLKGYGSYLFKFGLTAGSTFVWQSGTPLSEYGVHPEVGGRSFLRSRGTSGRTPVVVDLNLRLAQQLRAIKWMAVRPTAMLDVFHVASRQKPVVIDQLRFLGTPQQQSANPNYGKTLQRQPPITARLGLTMDW